MQASSRPTSREGINGAYDYLFERHLRNLTNLDNKDEAKKILKTTTNRNNLLDEEEEGSLTESDQLSALGNELVEASLEEVTDDILRTILGGGSCCTATAKKTRAKRVSFGPVPQIAFTTADDETRVDQEMKRS